MVCNDSCNYVSSLELIYRQLSQPCPPKPAPEPAPEPTPISLDASDVDALLRNKLSASVPELEWVLERAKQFNLSVRQRNDISLRVTIALAGRGRPAAHRDAGLFAQLDLVDIPGIGLLNHKSWWDRELRSGAQAIANCKDHRPPRCQCWRTARERLWHIQDRYGSRSPEAWAATRLWESLEELEEASRPGRAPGLGAQSLALPVESD